MSTDELSQLRARGEHRLTVWRRVITIVSVAMAVVFAAFGAVLIARHPRHSLLLGGLLLVMVAMLAGGPLLAMRYGPGWRPDRMALAFGARAPMRRRIDRALRAGRSDDPTVDAVVVDQRDKWLRVRKRVLVLFGLVAVLMTVRIAISPYNWVTLVSAVAAACEVGAVGIIVVRDRRLRAYRPHAQPD